MNNLIPLRHEETEAQNRGLRRCSRSQAALSPQFLFPEPSRKINMLNNSVSQEPLTENKSRASPDASGRPPDHSKAAWLSRDTSPWPLTPRPGCDSVSESQLTTGLYCSWKLSSSGEINMTQIGFVIFLKKGIALQNSQVSTVRDTDPGYQCERYCPQIQGQACGASGGWEGLDNSADQCVPALVWPFFCVFPCVLSSPAGECCLKHHPPMSPQLSYRKSQPQFGSQHRPEGLCPFTHSPV